LYDTNAGMFVCCLFIAVLWIEPRTSHMLGKCSATELHPNPKKIQFQPQKPKASESW
jgi:hypothetical protein